MSLPLALRGIQTPPTNPPAYSVRLVWNPSPDSQVAGYLLLWGQASGEYTNHLNVGNTNNATVTGLAASVTYYFNIVAYDTTGAETAPSNEIIYTVPPPPAPAFKGLTQTARTVTLTWAAAPGQKYQLQYNTNLGQGIWSPVGTPVVATNTIMTAVDLLELVPQKFYRLALIP